MLGRSTRASRHAHPVHPSELPFRRGGDRGLLAAGLGGYLAGALKANGFPDVHFIDAMTADVSEDELRRRIAEIKPDIVGATAITPSIYKAERVLEIAREEAPGAVTLLGGVHATFMYKQVLPEAPWIDAIVRGEGEEIMVNVARAVAEGSWPEARASIKGLAYIVDGKVYATPAAPTVKDIDSVKADWSILEWPRYNYIPLGTRVAIPNMARGCPFTCSFCSQWKFWRDYRIRDPKKVVDEIVELKEKFGVGFFILADEEPTINKKKFMAFCRELIDRKVGILWGINTRVTDILRDEKELALYPRGRADPCLARHRGRGAAQARPVQQGDDDRRQQEGDPAAARQRHRRRGAVHRGAGERDGRDAGGDLPDGLRLEAGPGQLVDVHALAVLRPVPRTRRQGRGVRLREVQLRDPIMKPDAMERGELLDRTMNNYRRFYMKKPSSPIHGPASRRAAAISGAASRPT